MENTFEKNLKDGEPEAKPRCLPEALRAVPSKNIFLSLIEKNWEWRAKSENAKKMFLLGTRALRAAAGRSDWFRSAILDKMSSSQTVKTHQYQKHPQLQSRVFLMVWG